MNMSYTPPETSDSPNIDLIERLGDNIQGDLVKHRMACFPPTAIKNFRRLIPTETERYLGVTGSYLRQIASQIFGPVDPATPRRSYSLEDLLTLREAMESRSRTPKKFIPHRDPTEKIQSIAVCNFKGGSAKTTSAVHLSHYLALLGHRVLTIDLDPQGSLTSLFGVNPSDIAPYHTLYGFLRHCDNPLPLQSIIRKTYIPNLDLIPADVELLEFEQETPQVVMSRLDTGGRILTRLSKGLPQIADNYDVIVIDCPPNLGYLTMVALTVATSLLVTVHPQYLDVDFMGKFLKMLAGILRPLVKAADTRDFSPDWIRFLLTRFEPTDGPQTQMAAYLRMHLRELVLQNATLKSTAISDAGLTSQTIYEVERNQFTRTTYDRALESVNAVNDEILALIRTAWGRQ